MALAVAIDTDNLPDVLSSRVKYRSSPVRETDFAPVVFAKTVWPSRWT